MNLGDFVLSEQVIYEIETWWYNFKSWPRSQEIADILNADVEEVENAYDQSIHHLKRRGVDRMLKRGEFSPTRLDQTRHDVALAISNIHDSKRLEAKLRSLKITETQYRGWLQDPLFAGFVEKRSEELITEELPEVSRNITRKAARGDLRAAKLLLEMTGRLSTTRNQINVFQNKDTSLFIVRQLVEVIKMHVKDPAVLELIARDFDKVMGAGTASNGLSLEAGSFEDSVAQGRYAIMAPHDQNDMATDVKM